MFSYSTPVSGLFLLCSHNVLAEIFKFNFSIIYLAKGTERIKGMFTLSRACVCSVGCIVNLTPRALVCIIQRLQFFEKVDTRFSRYRKTSPTLRAEPRWSPSKRRRIGRWAFNTIQASPVNTTTGPVPFELQQIAPPVRGQRVSLFPHTIESWWDYPLCVQLQSQD